MCHKNNNRGCVSFDFRVIFPWLSSLQPLATTTKKNPQDLLRAETDSALPTLPKCEAVKVAILVSLIELYLLSSLISGITKKKRWWISQDAHLKRQADEREQGLSIRRKARHSVVLLKRFKARASEKGERSLKCPVSQRLRLPAVLSSDAGKTFLINTHERQIEDERTSGWDAEKKAEREGDSGRQNEEWGD